jgi:virginiamycin B lyase
MRVPRSILLSASLGFVVAVLVAAAPQILIREFDVPKPRSRTHDPEVASDGALWYTGQMANKLGRLDPANGEFKEFPSKTPGSGPHGLVADAQGNIWFTAISKGRRSGKPIRTGQNWYA